MRTETVGRLTCRFVDQLTDGQQPVLIVVLCHGYGAPGSDLVPIGDEILNDKSEFRDKIQFVFPEAPLRLDEQGLPGGRAWWHLDLMRIQIAAATGQFRALRADRPDGLVDVRERLIETINAVSRKTGVPLSRFVVGGFSQGAMLTTDVALDLAANVARLVVMSGSLLNEAEWREKATRHAGLRVLQSHGRMDPLLPFTAAEWLCDLLTSSGIDVDFVSFAGEHQIPFQIVQKLEVALAELIKQPPATG